MSTALFAPCFLEGSDDLGNDRVQRNVRWIDYYLDIQKELGFTKMVLADNASPIELLQKLDCMVYSADGKRNIFFGDPHVEVYRFDERLTGKGGGSLDYPYCWRALWFINTLIDRGFEKIIMIDTDGFVLSERLAHHIRDAKTGWEAFWCKRHGFPDSSIHILNADCFDLFRKFTAGKFIQTYNGQLMERALPFTHINQSFATDRFGESREKQAPWMDYYGQASCDIELKYVRA